MQIITETGIDWRERRLINNLYVDESVKVRLDQRETRSVKLERGVRQKNLVCHRLHLSYTIIRPRLPRKILKVLETSK